MRKIQITQPDWYMGDDPPGELTVEGSSCPWKDAARTTTPPVVVDAYGRELRVIGVRSAAGRVELVVDTEVPRR